jgi:MoxR-like ATPase
MPDTPNPTPTDRPTQASNKTAQPPPQSQAKLAALAHNLSQVIQGKSDCIDMLILAVLAEGSVLLEDVPGVGKTTLAKALARSIDVAYQRIQFTPDLLPSDILGSAIYHPVEGNFTFRPGPIFCNVLLADEINRASPRTQSALLEAMNEQQVTIETTQHKLAAPFIVLATQNPIEFHGTYPLPEAQLDRFLLQLGLGYPDCETELDMLLSRADADPLDDIRPVLSRDDIVGMQQAVRRVRVDQSVARYLVDLVDRTRRDSRLKLGVSPRGSLMLFRSAQAAAFVDGREFVLPDDIQRLAPHVLAHRIVLTSKARYGNQTQAEVLEDILQRVPVPT